MQTEQHKLDLIRRIILLENFSQQPLEPLPASTGDNAARHTLVGKLNRAINASDEQREEAIARKLYEALFAAGIDSQHAVRIGKRSCELSNKAQHYFLFATQLMRAGFFAPLAGLSDCNPEGPLAPLWLLVADACVLCDQSDKAVEIYKRIEPSSTSAEVASGRLAALGNRLPPVRHAALDALLTLAQTIPSEDQQVLAAARAFALAPDDPRTAELLSQRLCETQRVYAADEVLRRHGSHSAGAAILEKRYQLAQEHGLPLLRLKVCLDGCLQTGPEAAAYAEKLKTAIDDPDLHVEWGNLSPKGRSSANAILRAIRTRSSVGRGYALVRAARKLHGAAQSLLLAFAAESYLAAGNQQQALEEARAACAACPWLPRAQAVLMACHHTDEGSSDLSIDSSTVEQALAVLPPFPEYYRAATELALREGWHNVATAWCHTWLALCPDDERGMRMLADIAIDSKDSPLIRTALKKVHRSWLSNQDRSELVLRFLQSLAELEADTVVQIIERLDLARLTTLEELQQPLDALLENAPHVRARLAVLRANSNDCDGLQRATFLLAAASDYAAAGKDELASEYLLAACQIDAQVKGAAELLASIKTSESENSPGDQRIAWVEAELLLHQDDLQRTFHAWRKLGALRWDLANDPAGAEAAFFRAGQLNPKDDYHSYGPDLFGRAKEATESLIQRRVTNLATDAAGKKVRSALLASGALAARDAGLLDTAYSLARAAVYEEPSNSGAIVLFEQVACQQKQWRKVDALYSLVAQHAAGRHGAHAAHYRATRIFVHHDQAKLALKHACFAFEALPSSKSSYETVVQLLEPNRDADETHIILEEAVSNLDLPRRAEWYRRFAIRGLELGGDAEQNLSMLLRGLALAPTDDVVRTLMRVCHDLIPKKSVINACRGHFNASVASALPQLKGTTGAAAAATLTQLALAPFASAHTAIHTLIRAMDIAPKGFDIDGIDEAVDALASVPDMLEELAQRLGEFCRNRAAGDDLQSLYDALRERIKEPLAGTASDDAARARVSDEGLVDTLRSDMSNGPPSSGDEPSQVAPKRRQRLFGKEKKPLTALKSAQRNAPSVPPPAKGASSTFDTGGDAEQQARRDGDYEWVARILEQRAAEEESPARRRLIRLRRAAVLEQRLQRIGEACGELEAVLRECGDDPTTLRYLANLYGILNRHSEAADAWQLTSQLSAGTEAHVQDVLNCCQAYIKAKRAASARRMIDSNAGLASLPDFSELRNRLAVEASDQDALSESSSDSPQTAPSALFSTPPNQADEDGHETVSAAAVDGEQTLRRLKRTLMNDADVSVDEAAIAIGELMAIDSLLPDLTHDLHTFVLVHFLRLAGSADAVEQQLQYHWEAYGQTPLVSILVAEGLVSRGEYSAALALYQWLLGEELDDIVTRGRVALAAASAAAMGQDSSRERYFLAIAASDSETRTEAEQQIEQLERQATEQDSHEKSPGDRDPLKSLRWDSAPPSAPTHDVPDLNLNTPLGVDSLDSKAAPPSTTPPLNYQPTFNEAAVDSTPIITLRQFGSAVSSQEDEAPPDSIRIEDFDLSSQPEASEFDEFDSLDDWELTAKDSDSLESTESFPISRRLSLETAPAEFFERTSDVESKPVSYSSHPPPRSVAAPFSGNADEASLLDELMSGSYEAGEALIMIYGPGPERSRDRLIVRQQQASLRRGDRVTLEHLKQAAQMDQDRPLAAAVAHVLGAFFPDDHPAANAPSLATLPVQTQATGQLLFQPIENSINEALAIVNATGLLRKGLADYGVTGTDRLPNNATTPLGRLFGTLSRLIDLGGARIFHVDRNDNDLDLDILLTSPLALRVSGAVTEMTPELSYRIGVGCAQATPALALLEGLDHSRASSLIRALKAAFGPTMHGAVATDDVDALRLVEELWHWVPRSEEQRLRELFQGDSPITYDAAYRRSRAVASRVGLFACGSLHVTLEQVLPKQALRYDARGRISTPLVELCKMPNAANLFDLAIRPEYAEARWRAVSSLPNGSTQ